MKNTSLLIVLLSFLGFSQDMTNDKLQEIYTTVSDSIEGSSGGWRFYVKDIPMMCITDTNYNRMRIISPITDAESVTDELAKAALIANFHTALDVKYAVSDGVLWSVFIHPLKELTTQQVKDAVSQVYYANVNFGTTFSSTSLVFPGKRPKDKEPEKEKHTYKRL